MVLQFSPGSGKMQNVARIRWRLREAQNYTTNRKQKSGEHSLPTQAFRFHASCMRFKSECARLHGNWWNVWPCLTGLRRPPWEPSHVCFASAVCCYRATALWHDTLMNRSVPCHTPAGQQSYRVSTSGTQERQTKSREKERERNDTKQNEMDPTVCFHLTGKRGQQMQSHSL